MNTIAHTVCNAAAGVVLMSFAAAPTMAEPVEKWPSRPVEFVVQNAPGGASDIFARTLARSAESILGQPVVVVNKAGGGGAAQMSAVRSAKPDGYTIGVNTLSHFTAMKTNLKGTFSPDDFSWIALVQQDAHVLFVRSDSPYQNFSQFVEGVKKQGGLVTTGGYGAVGSIANIAVRLATDAAAIGTDWVGYDSSTDAIAGLLGGHVELAVANPGPVMDFVKAGRVKLLGVLATERSPVFPDLPTFAEQGYQADGSWQQIRGIYGPAGIPQALQEKIAESLIKATRDPAFQKYQAETGIAGSDMGPAAYLAYISTMQRLADAGLKAAGLVK